MEVQGVSSKNTPADIFRLVETKIKKKEYDEAAMAFIVAMSYGQYDAKRVEDKTAHQAVAVLRMNTFNNLKQQEIQSFQTILGTLINKNELITKTLEELGKPDYYPKYMIQHGMGAFTGNKTKDGLVAGFNEDAAWKEILDQFTKQTK